MTKRFKIDRRHHFCSTPRPEAHRLSQLIDPKKSLVTRIDLNQCVNCDSGVRAAVKSTQVLHKLGLPEDLATHGFRQVEGGGACNANIVLSGASGGAPLLPL